MVNWEQECQGQEDARLGGWVEVGPVNDAFTIDQKQMGRPAPRTSDASTLRKFAGWLDSLTVKVHHEWNELPADEREAYKHFAYAMIEGEDERGGISRYFDRALSGWNLFLIALKGEQEAYVESAIALHRFVEAVLDAVERENPAYRRELAEALEDGLANDASKVMTVEEARERRRQLRHRVLG